MKPIFTSLLLVAACGEVQQKLDLDAPDPCASPNVCECTAATEGTDCGVHEFCNEGGTGRTCDCVAGYTNGGAGCVFTGGLIQDPGFQDATKWTSIRGALVNPTAVGSIEAGEVSFTPATLCSLGNITQTYEAPRFLRAEPLVLELSYKNQFDPQNFDHAFMGVSFNGGWAPLEAFQDTLFHTARICLPEGAYAPANTTGKGGPVTIALGPYLPPTRCPSSTIANFAIDHAAIVAANANECGTVPGQGTNFDAENGDAGWTALATGNSGLNFVAGIGVGGSRAARLNLRERCDNALLKVPFNVPDIANPALEVFVGTNATASLPKVRLAPSAGIFGPSVFDMLPPAPIGGTGTMHMCLPPSLRGQTTTLGFSVRGGTGSCADIVNNQIFADEVRVVDDPTCASTSNIANPGFEGGDPVPFGAFGDNGTSTAEPKIIENPALAHSGSKFLSIQSFGRCTRSGLTMMPTVPPSSGSSGPALKFFANVGVNANASTSVIANGVSTPLNEGGGYQQYTVCLDPLFVGRPQIVTINHDGGGGLCDNSNYPQQNAFIDDIEVTTDPACPAVTR
jgi:hypothetical protein